MDYTFVKIITQNADSHKENTIEQETMIDKYIGRGDMFVMYVSSNSCFPQWDTHFSNFW